MPGGEDHQESGHQEIQGDPEEGWGAPGWPWQGNGLRSRRDRSAERGVGGRQPGLWRAPASHDRGIYQYLFARWGVETRGDSDRFAPRDEHGDRETPDREFHAHPPGTARHLFDQTITPQTPGSDLHGAVEGQAAG